MNSFRRMAWARHSENVELQRYLRNTKWVKDSASPAEMKKFQSYVDFFKQYLGQYNFDYLMIAAQAYQESQLDQNKKNPSGAVGIMQVIPKYAAAAAISVPNVSSAQNNIEAGVKMLNNISDKYFSDGTLDLSTARSSPLQAITPDRTVSSGSVRKQKTRDWTPTYGSGM
jgi:membrane-bound lytic murein transglycosylase MltF